MERFIEPSIIMTENLATAGEDYHLSERDVTISRTDTTGRIVYVNEAFVKSSGYTREELTGQPHNIVRHPDMPEEVFRDLWATIECDRPWTGLLKNQRKNGQPYWVAANVTPVFEHGRKVGYMAVRTRPSYEYMNYLQVVQVFVRTLNADLNLTHFSTEKDRTDVHHTARCLGRFSWARRSLMSLDDCWGALGPMKATDKR